MKWVVAGNAVQFAHWCKEQGLDPFDPSEVRYVGNPEMLRGWDINPADVEYVGTCYDRKDLGQIINNLNIAGMKYQ